MELWDIYDENRVKQNRTMVRGEPYGEGDCHLVIHVCVFNGQGQMLIQKRQPFKQGFSGLWDVTVGGSAVMGDSSAQAAERELYEEIGLRVDLSHTRPHLTINREHLFDDFYLIEREVELSSLTLQGSEVEQVRWATREEILAMIDDGRFIPYYRELIGLLFAMRKKYGAHV